MKIIELSITNYRSITEANKLKIGDYTVLVGKNNEGKSNILSALNIAMNAILRHSSSSTNQYVNQMRRIDYDWNRDFPLQFQNRKSGLESRFRLTFQLEGEELAEFQSATGTRGNDAIPIDIYIGKNNTPSIKIPKQRSNTYNEKAHIVADFISRRIAINYIQAIRTDRMAVNALEGAIYNELMQLSLDQEYINARNIVERMEQNALDEVAKRIIEPVKVFIPELNNIKITGVTTMSHRRMYHDFDVIIDDGAETNISQKGDGIKSLLVLAILNNARKRRGASIVAVEEPESHLHSGAIHALTSILHDISNNSQVIITTHNPLFVQQNTIESNIIVDNRKAKTAKSIHEIRDVLGVLPSDNLYDARDVLLVEGEDDRIALLGLLPKKSKAIETAIDGNSLMIKAMGGASALSHDSLELKNLMCRYMALLDNDQAANTAIEKALEKNYIDRKQIRQTICNGKNEAEFEDCLRVDFYSDIIAEDYGILLENAKLFKNNNNKEKWSVRMGKTFTSNGIDWSDATKKEIKMKIADRIYKSKSDINSILISEKSGFIDNLVNMLEKMISHN